MDRGPAGLIPSIQQINAPLPPVQPAGAVPTPAPQAEADPWLAEQRREHPEQFAQPQPKHEAEDEQLAALREEHGYGETIASKFVQGALDALLAPGALLGAEAESAGELFRNKALRDFGRGLGEASSGKSAMEAFAGLANAAIEGSAYRGAEYSDLARQQLEELERARPMLSTLSRMAGMSALAITGGATAEGGGAAMANVLMNAAEGAAGGTQAAYEQGASLRDVLTSGAVGGVLGGAISGAAEGFHAGADAIKKRAPDLAAAFGEKVQKFADERALKAVIDRDRGAWKTFMRGGDERIQRVAQRIRDANVLGKGDDAMLEELSAQSAKANGELAKLADSFDAARVTPDITRMDAEIAQQIAELESTGSYSLQQVARRLRREIEPFRAKLKQESPPPVPIAEGEIAGLRSGYEAADKSATAFVREHKNADDLRSYLTAGNSNETYAKMNGQLWGRTSPTPEITEKIANVQKLLTDAKAAGHAVEGVGYRAANLRKASVEELENALTSGKDLTFKGFTSMSADRDAAMFFSSGADEARTPVLMRIRQRSGIPVASVGDTPGEAELLLPHGSKFRVIRQHEEPVYLNEPDFGGKVRVYDLEEVPEAGLTAGLRAPTFSELRTFKQGLGEAINWNGTDPIDLQMKKLWGTVTDGLNNAADQAGPGYRQMWRESNEASSDFLTLKRAMEKQIEGKNVRRFISPSDYATSIGAGLATLLHSANPIAAGAAAIGSALGHKVIREGGSSLISSLANRFARTARHIPLSKAGGPEAQEILQTIAKTRAFMEDTAARAGANPTLQQAASESAKQVAGEQIAKRAGAFDAERWYEKPLSPLQKMLYRTQVLDRAAGDLSEIAKVTNELRPPMPPELDARRLSRLMKDGDTTAGIGSLQSAVEQSFDAAPPTPTGEQAAVALRNLGLTLQHADPAEAMARTHATANWLQGAAEFAQDDLSKEFVARAESALRAELSDPARWGGAGKAYQAMTAAPGGILEPLSNPEAIREALRAGNVQLGGQIRAAYDAIREAHEAAFKLTGQRVQAAKEITTAMKRAEKLFDAADAAVRIDGKPMSKIFDAAKTSGVYGAATKAAEVNGSTVQEHVEQGLEKISPVLKEASGGGYRPGAAVGSEYVPHEVTRAEYDQRLHALSGAASQPEYHDVPGMYAGISPIVGEKLAQLLADMPKPQKSIHGSPFDSLSRADLQLANSMWEATTEPMSVFTDLAAGRLDPDKASYAWKQYPGLQQAAQLGTLDVLMHDLSEEERTRLPDGILTQIDAALGFGGALQDANQPSFAQRMSALYQPAPPKAQPNAMLQTPLAEPTFTDRIAGGT